MPRPELFLPRGIPCAKHCSTSEFQLCLPAWFLVVPATRRAKPQPLLTAFLSWLLVFLTWAKNTSVLGQRNVQRQQINPGLRESRVLASKVRRPSVWLSENVPNRSGYDSLGAPWKQLQPWGISDSKFFSNVKRDGKKVGIMIHEPWNDMKRC